MRNVLFVVDEASMVSGLPNESSLNESLLEGLMSFVYGRGSGCRIMFIGDDAQLPPVGEADSPALRADIIRQFGIKVYEAQLNSVVRQEEMSGILYNATVVREQLANVQPLALPHILFDGFDDIFNIPGNNLIETLTECYQKDGIDETMVVCRSNKRAVVYNNGIRNQILGREEEISSGDLLMVAKNNYHWLDSKDGNFIANGDVAVVKRVRNFRDMYGFHFADCELAFPDYDDLLVDATVLLDTLHSEAPALTREQQDSLFTRVLEDYADISTKSERMKKMKEDPYFNALQVKYAYAVTCHKAQGGQWSQIFIDQGYMTEEMLGPDYFRWLYTAITRATHTVHFVNWRTNQTLDAEEDE
jgi:exodeoxyribonuclease-5